MVLDVEHAEHAGGGPGYVVVRVTGRARADSPSLIAAPSLLIDDGAGRLVRITGDGSPIEAGPQGVTFAIDFAVPLHLAATGSWWLEPGAVLASRADLLERIAVAERRLASARAAALHARLDALADEVADLRRDLAATPAPSQTVGPTADTVATPTPTTARPSPVPRPVLRRLRPTLPAMLLTAGALAVADAAATILWQEPITSIYAAYEQHAVSGDLAKLDTSLAVAAPALPIAPEQRMRTLASALEQTADAGQGIARLRIPRLGLDDVVVQGTGGASLRRGPGHYAGTALPGQPGTVGIAGHRTTYGAPFRRLDALRRGDRIDVRMPYGDFRYRVEATRIVRPEDVSVLAGAGHDRLALTACHPLYSAAQRLVVLARLENATARGAAATARAPAPAPAPSEATPPAGPSADAGAAQSPRA